MLSLFSGSGGNGFNIVALGVYPYITAQIAIQILLPVIPRLEELSREGEAGRTKLNQITRLVHHSAGHAASLWAGRADFQQHQPDQ